MCLSVCSSSACSEDNCAVCPNNACEECAEGYRLVRRSDSNQCQGQAFASGILTGGALTVFDLLFVVGGCVILLVLGEPRRHGIKAHMGQLMDGWDAACVVWLMDGVSGHPWLAVVDEQT